jgi:chemotaxis protein methyltransferase CheR
LRWAGFDGVHGQVAKRALRRARELGLGGFEGYRAYLEANDAEWAALDALCYVTISRFYRERAVFELLRSSVMPDLAARARGRGAAVVRALCLGAAGGEESYSLRMVWENQSECSLSLLVVAVETAPAQLARARAGLYNASALVEVPPTVADASFERVGNLYRIQPWVREGVTFVAGDVRDAWPPGPFDLVLCRNLAFTYFDEVLQQETLGRIVQHLVAGGVLVIGRQDTLPRGSDLIELVPGSGAFAVGAARPIARRSCTR